MCAISPPDHIVFTCYGKEAKKKKTLTEKDCYVLFCF